MLLMEIEIEEQLYYKMCNLYNYSEVNMSQTMARSQLLEIYTEAATEVRNRVILTEKEKKKRVDDDLSATSASDSEEETAAEEVKPECEMVGWHVCSYRC